MVRESKKVAIIGAGPSGLIAGIFAARNGCRVTIFEKEKKIGRKLLITGNGQCNITNNNISSKRYHGENPKILNNIFSRFGLQDTIDFFEELGLPLREGKKGKLFPYSLQAATVVSLLEHELKKLAVTINLNSRVDSISKISKGFTLKVSENKKERFDSIILSSGSCTYEKIGGTSLGYDLAATAGHQIIKPFPAIIPLNIPLKILHRLEGIKWDAEVSAIVNGKRVAFSREELLFTKYGISGPATLEVSRWVNRALIEKKDVNVKVDLFPDYNHAELRDFLEITFSDNTKPIWFSLSSILKKKMPNILLKIASIDPDKKATSLNEKEKNRLIDILKGLTLKPGEARSFNEAVVAAGGISTNEINPSTMESKIVKGMFITGEVLDIDGESGGFNLQFAWSSGAIAGLSQF